MAFRIPGHRIVYVVNQGHSTPVRPLRATPRLCGHSGPLHGYAATQGHSTPMRPLRATPRLCSHSVSELYKQGQNSDIAFSGRNYCAKFLFVEYSITHCVPWLGLFRVYILRPIVQSIYDTIYIVLIPNIYNYITFKSSLEEV